MSDVLGIKKLRELLPETRSDGYDDFIGVLAEVREQYKSSDDAEVRAAGRLIELMCTAAIEGGREQDQSGVRIETVLLLIGQAAGFATACAFLTNVVESTPGPVLMAAMTRSFESGAKMLLESNGML